MRDEPRITTSKEFGRAVYRLHHETHVRVCEQCRQFHNWRLLADDRAVCLNCGHLHGPRPATTRTP